MNGKFSYFKRGNQYYPLIDVELTGPKRKLVVKALVDSGATFSLFRPEIAEYLGIPISNGRKIRFHGIKAKILGYLHQIPVKINHKRFDCYIAFSPDLKISFNILGRRNFFYPFLITFNEKQQEILLEENKWNKK
jgi:hypothetical protein